MSVSIKERIEVLKQITELRQQETTADDDFTLASMGYLLQEDVGMNDHNLCLIKKYILELKNKIK